MSLPFELTLICHILDLRLRQIEFLLGDRETLFVACAFVPRCYLQDSVRIDPETHIYFFLSFGSRSYVADVEFGDLVVVRGQFRFTLEDLDLERGLIIAACRIFFHLFNWYLGVSRND